MTNGTFHKYLLYFVSVIIGMMLWAITSLSSEVIMIRNIQSEQKQRVESIADLHGKLERISVQIATIATADVTLKRHEDMLRRLEDRLNAMRQTPNAGAP